VVISVVLIIISLAKAWTQNTEKDELVVNLFEKYIGTVIRAGLLFPFPFFGWIELFETEMEDDDLFLFQFPDENGKMKIGNFDLKNASLPLLAKVFFRVIDSYKFVYGHKNATQAMLEYVEAFMRRVLIYHEEGQPDRLMNLEEAMMLKSAELIDHFSSVPDGEETVNEKDSSRKLSEKDFILQNWGIEIFSIKIIDFEMTDGQRADFDKVLTAQKNRETALINADIEFIQKEGVARGIERLALAKEVELSKTANGFANSVKVLVESGMRPDQALRHFQEMAKWQNPNSTHVTGNTGFVGMGAGFENGRNTYNRNRQPRENN
jgi:regulator of protease activity HflC (stomatin/prohibitin superfamily)